MSIEERLKKYHPYVLGMRIEKGISIIDAVFTQGWHIPKNGYIQVSPVNGQPNYFMLFSDKEGVGIDHILAYVDVIIQTNLEKQKKLELITQYAKQLQDIFRENSLAELQTLKFVLDNGAPSLDEPLQFDLNTIDPKEELGALSESKEESSTEGELNVAESLPIQSVVDKDIATVIQESKEEEPIPPEEDSTMGPDGEINEEFEIFQLPDEDEPVIKNGQGIDVELPPRQVIELEDLPEINAVCKCAPGDVCPVCMQEEVV